MAAKTILLKGEGNAKEGVSAGAITPGHLVARDAAGAFVAHAAAAGTAQKSFAKENELAGQGIDVAYAALDRVFYFVAEPGDEVQALVAANAPAIVIGDKLESAGDGTVRKVLVSASTSQAQRNSIIGEAIEAVDNSAGATPARLIMEVY